MGLGRLDRALATCNLHCNGGYESSSRRLRTLYGLFRPAYRMDQCPPHTVRVGAIT